jgi:glycosyltransferase involved in cell wall biosynthesis
VRIAIIAPPWVPVPPPAYGGTEAVLDSLARGLHHAGHEVLLFATGDSTCEVDLKWIREHAAGTVATGSATELHHVINAYEAVVDWRADVVHDHTLVGPVYGRRFDIPVVTTNHGPFDGELFDYYRTIAADVPIIAISHHHASTTNGIPVAAVIHHAVDVDAFPVGDGDGGYCVFLGRMSPDKGVDIAARVARRAGVSLRIAAKMREPAEYLYFEHEVAPLLGGGVEYVGELERPEKLQLLADASCLLNTLAWPEPFGMVMIEALACGTPVVGTPRGSVPELIVDGVTGFVRGDEADLAGALRCVGELDRGRCRKEAEERFSTDRMVDEHLAFYERVVGERRRS